MKRKVIDMAKGSLVTQEMIAAFGKAPTKIPAGRTTGITKRQWDAMVRGEKMPTEQPIKRVEGKLHLRCGFGSK